MVKVDFIVIGGFWAFLFFARFSVFFSSSSLVFPQNRKVILVNQHKKFLLKFPFLFILYSTDVLILIHNTHQSSMHLMVFEAGSSQYGILIFMPQTLAARCKLNILVIISVIEAISYALTIIEMKMAFYLTK